MVALPRILAALPLALSAAHAQHAHHWGPSEWKGLITFGNSYTDDSRLGYFASNNGTAPPVGWKQPVVSHAVITG